MREVVILGVGLHPFGRFPEKKLEDLGRVVISNALDEAGVPFKDVEAAYVGHLYAPCGTGERVVTQFGHTGIPIVNLEVACTSSTQCLIRGAYEIATGLYDVVLAVGIEKMGRGLLPGLVEPDSFAEVMGLLVTPAMYAMIIQKHMHNYGTTREQIGLCSVKSHKNGALNPNAQYQEACTLEEVLSSRMIADPITLLMCSPTSDGASAVVLCAKEKAKKYSSKRPITIAAWGLGSPAFTRDVTVAEFAGLQELSKKVYEKAGIGPEDVDVAQVHDAFSPGEIFIPEMVGLIPEGEGGPWVEAGKTEINGQIPINTDGGMVSRGHPIGATGLAQVTELVLQLRGEAGPRQVSHNPKVAFQHNEGLGGMTLCVYKR